MMRMPIQGMCTFSKSPISRGRHGKEGEKGKEGCSDEEGRQEDERQEEITGATLPPLLTSRIGISNIVAGDAEYQIGAFFLAERYGDKW
jgi:hypothetical protein